MKNKAVIIAVDGSEEVVSPRNGRTFELDEMQAIVGGLIEIVSCKDDSKLMVINEEGKLNGLPLNEKATELYVHGSLDPDAWNKGVGDSIVGVALVADRALIE